MEIERKYLIQKEQIPFTPADYPCRHIEQGYLCTDPVVRVRRDNEKYFLTYKSKGLMVREEYDLPLDQASYEHLKTKIDGRLITKDRYVIPLSEAAPSAAKDAAKLSAKDAAKLSAKNAAAGISAAAMPPALKDTRLFIELDFFKGDFDGLILAEVEFPNEHEANTFCPPAWFGEDVTRSAKYHNSTMSKK